MNCFSNSMLFTLTASMSNTSLVCKP